MMGCNRMKRVSYGHCVAMELKRGFLERRLWVFMVIMLAYWTFMTVLWEACEVQILVYYVSWGATDFDGLNIPTLVSDMLNDTIFIYFIPFLATVVYAFSIVDDRVSGFARQVYSRTGFARYYAGKLTASGVIGAFFCAAQMGVIFVVASVANIFMRARLAADGVTNVVDNYFYAAFSGNSVDLSFARWILLGFAQLLLAGALYGLMAALLAFFTDNKLLVFVVPVFVPQLFDKVMYLIGLPLSMGDSTLTAYETLSGFKLGFDVSDLGTACTTVAAILCLALVCLLCRGRLGLKYAEGGR